MLIARLPFHKAQSFFNEKYYARGSRYAREFRTHASHSSALAAVDAAEFHSLARTRLGDAPDVVHVLELGPGNGNNARAFLARLEELDLREGTRIAPAATYTLLDSSARMLADARANILRRPAPRHRAVRCIRADAASPAFDRESKFLYARANELFDDLPTRLLAKAGRAFSEAWLDIHADAGADDVRRWEFEVSFRPARVSKPSLELLRKAFGGIPEGAVIPFNCGALACMRAVAGALLDGGVFSAFDYGFSSRAGLVRLHTAFHAAGALTAFVNFPLLAAAARQWYSSARVAPQRALAAPARSVDDARFFRLRLQK